MLRLIVVPPSATVGVAENAAPCSAPPAQDCVALGSADFASLFITIAPRQRGAGTIDAVCHLAIRAIGLSGYRAASQPKEHA